jgi:hypothetical protein
MRAAARVAQHQFKTNPRTAKDTTDILGGADYAADKRRDFAALVCGLRSACAGKLAFLDICLSFKGFAGWIAATHTPN